jgi:hypothetical protein
MEALGSFGSQGSGLQLWGRYLREAVAPAFGLTFSRAIWNVGFVTSPQQIFLLVNLEEKGGNPEYRYINQFASDREFNWQSQKRTTQESRSGQMIRDHKGMGLGVHLLVRPGRRGPFIYCGEVDFHSWEGNAPISVRWRLREPVPTTLWETLQIPS